MQRHDLQTIGSRRRLSYSDKQLQILYRVYGAMLAQNFTKEKVGDNLWGMSLREMHGDRMALQTQTIRLMKQHGGTLRRIKGRALTTLGCQTVVLLSPPMQTSQ